MRTSTLCALCWVALVPSACAVVGYDFGDYQRASGTSGGGPPIIKQEPTSDGGHEAGSAGEQAAGGSAALTAGAAGQGGGASPPIGPEPTTFDVGGAPGESGAGGAPHCTPRDCLSIGSECGPTDDGCGQELDCGSCGWWFLECRQNLCEFVE